MGLAYTLVPDSDVSNTGGPWTFGGSSAKTTFWESTNANNTSVDYAQTSNAGTFICGLQNSQVAQAIESVSITMSVIDDLVGGGQVRSFIDIAGTKYYGAWYTLPDTNYHTQTDVITKAGGFTPSEANSMRVGWESDVPAVGGRHSCSYLAAVGTLVPVPPSVDVVRFILSVYLWLKKRAESFAAIKANLDILSVGLMGRIDVEHIAGPHPTAQGWGSEAWQRRPMAIHGLNIDQNAMTVTVDAKDQRPILCLVRDLAWSDKASGSLGDGIARFANPGALAVFSRASETTITNPVGESETLPADIPAYGAVGIYIRPASGARAAERYYYTNNAAARTWNAAQGGFQCEATFDTLGGDRFVSYVYHDANNRAQIYYSHSAGRWYFYVLASGVSGSATFDYVPTAGVVDQIGATWTGANAENGVAAYTLSIFVNRVKGTTAVANGAMTQAATSAFDIGSGAGTSQFDGRIRKIHSYQYVPTDVEMMRPI